MHRCQRLESTRLHKHLPEDAIRMLVLECRPEFVKSIQSAQVAVPVHRTAQDSLQTPTGTKTRLHVTAIIVGHRIRPESIPKYVRLGTILVVGVEREDTLIHYAEVVGHPYT